jgi:hypothetical protein
MTWWFLETVLFNVQWSFAVSVDFRQLFLFADVTFLGFVFAEITLETVAPDTPNNLEVFATHVSVKWAPTICPPLKLDKSAIFRFCHTEYLTYLRSWALPEKLPIACVHTSIETYGTTRDDKTVVPQFVACVHRAL